MSLGGMVSWANLKTLLRVGVFGATVGLLSWLSLLDVGRTYFSNPVTELSVVVCHYLISLFGGTVEKYGTILTGPIMSLDIKDGCNGVMAMILFSGAVVAHEKSVIAKMVGLIVGIPLIWFINLFRILSLYVISVVAPARLEFFHIFFWQILIIIFVVLLWFAWASYEWRSSNSTAYD